MSDTTTRTTLTPMPPRIARLPVDPRGYPVPWFVAWVPGPNGEKVADFRVVDAERLETAIKWRRCFVCGEPLGRHLAFPIGPMCTITRTTPEPPMHLGCAEWSVINCPFLSQPKMVRRPEGLPEDHAVPAGEMIRRNPGVTCVWSTRSFERFPDRNGGWLITVGEPTSATWWREGRPATRAEVEDSVASGLPILLEMARSDGPAAVASLNRQYEKAQALFPS